MWEEPPALCSLTGTALIHTPGQTMVPLVNMEQASQHALYLPGSVNWGGKRELLGYFMCIR